MSKQPVQINKNKEWGSAPREENRLYSIYGGVSALKVVLHQEV